MNHFRRSRLARLAPQGRGQARLLHAHLLHAHRDRDRPPSLTARLRAAANARMAALLFALASLSACDDYPIHSGMGGDNAWYAGRSIALPDAENPAHAGRGPATGISVRGGAVCFGTLHALRCQPDTHAQWVDHSETWPSLAKMALHDVWLAAEGDLFAVGGLSSGEAAVVRIFGHGSGFSMFQAGQGSLRAVHGRTPADAMAVGQRPKGSGVGAGLAVPDPDGTGWMSLGLLATHPALNDLHIKPDGSRVAVGEAGVALYSADGSAWSVELTGVPNQLRGVWSSDTGPFFAVGDGNTLLIREGAGWKQAASSTPQTSRWLDVDGSITTGVFAVGDQDVARYDGQSWRLLQVQGLPDYPELRAVAVQGGTDPPTIWLGGSQLSACELVAGSAGGASLQCVRVL